MDDKRKIKILQDLIQIPSENDHEEKVALYLQALLKEYGIDSELVEYIPGRANLVASIEGQGPGKILGLSGHMDVVAAGDPANWTHDPFAGEIVDGRMYGRGTTDMKAGLAALVLAMIEIKENQLPFKGEIRLLATVGEEIGMYGSKQLVDEGYADGLDGLIVAEPSGAEVLVYCHKGSIQYEIISHGKAAHSSMPDLGIDALQQMVDYINVSNQKFQALKDQGSHPVLGETINVNTVIEGGDQINSVPEKVVMKANARIIPQVDNEAFLDAVEESLAEVNEQIEGRLELKILQNNPPVDSQPDSQLIQIFKKVTGKDLAVIGLGGATDASNFGRLEKPFDLAIYGPGESSLAHVVDEYVEVDDYLSFIDVYKQAIVDYLSE